MATGNTGKRIRYRRRGGLKLVILDRAENLPVLKQLHPRQWRVLSCPAAGHEMSDAALKAMDVDADGRIRVRDVQQTIAWLEAVLAEMSLLEAGTDELRLDAVRRDTATGRAVLASAEYLLGLLGEAGKTLSLNRVAAAKAIMENSPMNGEGIVDSTVSADPMVTALIDTVVATVGGVNTRRGSKGVDRAKVDEFVAACEAFAAWHARGYGEGASSELFFLGEQTETAMEALIAVESKLDEWFQQCAVFAFAPDLVKARQQAADLAERPLAALTAEAVLSLREGINPAWRERIDRFWQTVLATVFTANSGKLREPDWAALRARFATYRQWRDGQVGSSVSSLGIERIRELLQDQDSRQQLVQLIDRDCSLRDEIRGVEQVERLLLLKRDFWEFAHNFVNFDHFYAIDRQAIFQIGTLHLDARSFHLCLSVNDLNKHAQIASKAGLYLIYGRCSRKDTPNGPVIAAAITRGAGESLFVGKHGIFYDRESLEWDVEIIRILENPINLRQAILAPFRRLGAVLANYVESLTASREKAWQTQVLDEVKQIEQANGGNAPPAPQRPPVPVITGRQGAAGMGGFIAGGGFAFAAVTSSLALLSSTLSKIHPLYMLSAIASVIALVVLPTALLAWIRLRERDIGKLLEANDWAVNGKIPLSKGLGKALTARSD